jgi:alcohol dehydrogenase, propanol-preferring
MTYSALTMRAMVLHEARQPLLLEDVPAPKPGPQQILVRVDCCAVCRTDLHVADGELREPTLPLILGHQIVGTVEKSVQGFRAGTRVGIPWLGWTCGVCEWCTSGRENLCDSARFTGYTLDGGYAELALADARYCFAIPDTYDAEEAAPLLCGGLIGFRAYRMIGEARRLGIYGFGSAAQIVAQIARADDRDVFAFTRPDDRAAQDLAMSMGAKWAGGSDVQKTLDAAIIFAPVGALVINALRNVVKGGSVICAGIHMSDIPSIPYELLWGERSVRSVANLTRDDANELFSRLKTLRVHTRRIIYPLTEANEALDAVRSGEIAGTAVLKVSG